VGILNLYIGCRKNVARDLGGNILHFWHWFSTANTIIIQVGDLLVRISIHPIWLKFSLVYTKEIVVYENEESDNKKAKNKEAENEEAAFCPTASTSILGL
jgi:hypothetical protein